MNGGFKRYYKETLKYAFLSTKHNITNYVLNHRRETREQIQGYYFNKTDEIC